ncbi:MAG: LCP family protein [Clostridia bacterium]|nr:LCP family protein [Clostridia bacterium]
MNIKRFIISFSFSTILLLTLFITVGFIYIYNSNLGLGEEIAELDKAVPNQTKNIVVMGTDKSGLHSDVIMIFSVSTKNQAVSCTSIPRDTRVNVRGSYIKITEAMAYGGESTVIQELKELTGLQVHDYVTFSFKAVEDVIDALGGVDFYVPQNMFYQDPEQDLYINLKKGQQLLNGDKSLQLLRFRSYPLGDIQRTKVQREFMQAVFEQKANAKYIANVPKVYAAVNRNIKSSLSLAEVKDYAVMISKMENPEFNNIELPYSLAGNFVILNREDVSKIFVENFY